MALTRRDFVRAGAAAAALAALPRPLLVHLGSTPEPVPPIEDPRLKELAMAALDAARTAGATYADVRLTRSVNRFITPDYSNYGGDLQYIAVGVRSLVDGYWGFASSPVWSRDEMARLGKEAVHQAKVNSLGNPREVDLAPVSAVADGHWATPVKIDPFAMSPFEIMDYLGGLTLFAERTPGLSAHTVCSLRVEEKAFGSTVGTYCTQRLYRTRGEFSIRLRRGGKAWAGSLDTLMAAAVGWELYRDQPVREQILQLIAEGEEDMRLPHKPVEIGRYDAVFEAAAVATVLSATLGVATQLDRALGYEANASGTSYIDDPFGMLGRYKAGAPLITLTANRSQPGGLATVKWDDEGVAPDDFTLVRDGVLTDFQTIRESAGWMKGWYAQHGRPFRSHGCADAPSALEPQMQYTPNLMLAPGHESLDFDGVVAGLANGIAVRGLGVDMDFQNLNGLATASRMYEVKHGKRVALIDGARMLFRAPEFWTSLRALGGPASARRFPAFMQKGDPPQFTTLVSDTQVDVAYSVSAPPGLFKGMALIDPVRKA